MSATDNQAAAEGHSILKGALFVALGGIFVGLAPIGLRLSEMGPQATAFWRFAFALPLLYVFAKARNIPLGRPNWQSIVVGIAFGLDIALWHAALTKTSVANATFLVNLGSVSAGLIAWLIFGQRPRAIWPIAACFAITGAAAMSFGSSAGGSGDIHGDILALTAAMSLAIYFVMLGPARRNMNAIAVLFWATIAEACVSTIASLTMGESILPAEMSQLAAPLFLAVFAHVLGQGFIIFGGGMAPPSVTGVVIMMQPVVAGLVAWPLFKEHLSPMQLAGGAAILFGVWLAGKR